MAETIRATRCNHALLVWARKAAGLSVAEAAHRAGVAEERLLQWEAGGAFPTMKQLRKLANHYDRPVVLFFRNEPPEERIAVPDMRRLPQGRRTSYSPNLIRVIREVLSNRDWAAEWRAEEGAEPLEFVGSVSIGDDYRQVARSLRDRLGISLADQRQWRDAETGFRRWREAVERIGVLVFRPDWHRNRSIPIEEMRGIAFSHPLAPAIVINGKEDTHGGRLFTLAHECVHILLGVTGVSNSDVRGVPRPRTENDRVEQFCNRTASETLIPSADFIATARQIGGRDSRALVARLQKVYSVSYSAIAYRLHEAKFIDSRECDTLLREYTQHAKHRETKDEVKIPGFRKTLATKGQGFSRMVLQAYDEGFISLRDVGGLLNTTSKQMAAIEASLLQTE